MSYMDRMDAKPRPLEADEFPDEPGVFDIVDEAAEAEADARALAEVDAGQFISNEAMTRWLRSWGTPNELPPPECGE
jgi:predicted transcriptional regulator